MKGTFEGQHSRAEFVHPKFGSVTVWYRWKEVTENHFTWVPTAMEFDLFTPRAEQEKLYALATEEMNRV